MPLASSPAAKRSCQTIAQAMRRQCCKQNGSVESFNVRIRDELLNETQFSTVRQARSILARWVHDYNTGRPHSSLVYATPAAFAAELEKEQAGLNPPVAPPALLRVNNGWSLIAV